MYYGNHNAVRGRGGFVNSSRDNYPRQHSQSHQPQPQSHSVSHYSQVHSQSHYSNETSMRYTPTFPTQSSGPSFNADDSMCYDPLRAHMTSWTPRFNPGEAPNWDTASRSPPRDTRPDPYQYRGSLPRQMSSSFNDRYYHSNSNNYEQQQQQQQSQQQLRGILKSRSSEVDYESNKEQNFSSCREIEVAPAPDLKNVDEEDSFLYGNGSDSRDKVMPSCQIQKPQPILPEARPAISAQLIPPSLPPPEEVTMSSSSSPAPAPPPPMPPPPPPTPPAPVTIPSSKENDYDSERNVSHSYNSRDDTPPVSHVQPVRYNPPQEPVSVSQLPRIPRIVPQKPATSETNDTVDRTEPEDQTDNAEKEEEIEKLSNERDKLSQQLISLKALLEKTIKKEADLLRNRQQKTGSKDPHVIENQKLMADVRKRIEAVHDKHIDLCKKLSRLKGENQNQEASNEQDKASSGTPSLAVANRRFDEDEEDDSDNKFVYYDAGNHWCEQCDEMIPKVKLYFDHLHTKEHWKKFPDESEPWKPRNQKPKPAPSDDQINTPMKGSEFLIPVKGFYCNLCAVFMGNANHAEEHLKTARHNRSYVRHTLLNPQYEHKHNSDKGKALGRKQQEERKRQKEEQEKEEREKAKQRRKQEEETRKKEKAERLKEERRKKDEDRKENHREKERQRDRERERERERKRAADSSADSSPSRDATSDVPMYGPHFPFNDRKLAMRTIVNITERDYRRAYKANLKAILKQNKRQKLDNAAAASAAPLVTTTCTPVFDNEDCDIDTGDILAQINKKCDDFDAMKQEEDYGLMNEAKSVASEEKNDDSPPKSEENGDDDFNFEINPINLNQVKSTTNPSKVGLVVMKQIDFDDDFMEPPKEDDSNNIAGPIENSDNESVVVNNVMFPTLDLNDLTKSPPYTSNFATSDDILNHMDYS